MQNKILRHAVMFAMAVVTFTTWKSQALAQNAIDVCLKTGVTIRATSVLPSGGGYAILPMGSNAAITVAADQVQTIGAACRDDRPATQSPPATQYAPLSDPASPRFGVYGADIIGARLMPALIDAYAAKRGWTATAEPAGADGQEIELSAPGATQPSAIIDLKITNSAEGIAALADGAAAIAMTSRRTSPSEAAQIRARHGADPLSPSSGAEHVVALDAVAAIVHRDNPIKRLRLDQIAQIFSGQISNWSEVQGWNDHEEETSGPDAPIRLHALDAKSDNYAFFKTAVLDPSGASLAPAAEQHDTGKKLSQTVGKDVHAIGFVEFSNISRNDALSIGTKCGVSNEASRYSVKTERYPLARRLYLYTAGEPRQSAVRDFLQFVLSDEAQAVIRDAGFIDQSLEYQDLAEQRYWFNALIANPVNTLFDHRTSAAAQNAPTKKLMSERELKDWRKAAKRFIERLNNLRRTSIVFRFESNSSELDARALQDVERLSRYIQSKSAEKAYFTILGFSDSSGNLFRNLELSKRRSDRVTARLKQLGIAPAKGSRSMGQGSMAPVACNDTEEGRAKNRHVEAWLPDPGSN